MYDPNKSSGMTLFDTGLSEDDDELGKLMKGKVGKKLKKGLKAVATGGISLAAPALKKTKIGAKILKGAKALATGGISLLKKPAKLKKAVKSAAQRTVKALADTAAEVISPAAEAVLEHVQEKTAGECECKSELANLVAAKLVAQLGPPLDAANKLLAKFELQRQATYEHRKLMQDDDFRRQVLTRLVSKAKQGNKSCQRTVAMLRG